MLAAAASVVRVPTVSTPEQAAIDRSLGGFWVLVERLHAAAEARAPIHQVEETLFRALLAINAADADQRRRPPAPRLAAPHGPSEDAPPSPSQGRPRRGPKVAP